MADEIVGVARSGNYATVTLNRPDKHNALNEAMVIALSRALDSLEQDKAVRALLLRGEGLSFCAGIDLQEADRLEGGHNPMSLERLYSRLANFAVPTIAAIRGAAIAGGLQLALHCDLRVASDNARLGMTLGKIGLTLPFDFARKLVEIVGAPNTNYILFTAELIRADRALQMAMVHEVVTDSKLDQAATALAERVAANAPLSLRAMKAAVRRAMSAAFDAEHDDIDETARAVRESRDFKEGVRAFLEKRKPVWRAE